MAAIVWLSFGHASEQPTASPLAQASASSLAQEAATLTQRKKRSAGYPKRTAIAHALAWAGQREGNVGVAIVDSHGLLRGYHAHRQFQSASLAKAMLLVAYLGLHPRPAVSKRATLTKMIEESDNASADVIFAQVRNAGLKAVARLAGMQEFEVGTSWIDTEMKAADQARFFYAYEEHLPERARAFAGAFSPGSRRRSAGDSRRRRLSRMEGVLQGRLVGLEERGHEPGCVAGEARNPLVRGSAH